MVIDSSQEVFYLTLVRKKKDKCFILFLRQKKGNKVFMAVSLL